MPGPPWSVPSSAVAPVCCEDLTLSGPDIAERGGWESGGGGVFIHDSSSSPQGARFGGGGEASTWPAAEPRKGESAQQSLVVTGFLGFTVVSN